MTHKLIDDCFLHDKDRLSHAEALAILRDRLVPVASTETVTLDRAAGRIAAETVSAPRNIPAHSNAAVDGYAFAARDYDPDKGSLFAVGARVAAGHEPSGTPVPGQCVRIFTGAVMPEGLDSVVMQEDVRLSTRGGQAAVFVPPGLKPGANRRLAGEDMRAGQTIVAQGLRLRPQDIAAIAASGRGALSCFAPLRVAVFSTGDEVIRAGAAFAEGRVYDANAPMIHALVGLAGAASTDLGVLPDDGGTVRRRLADAAAQYDLILTSGGASRGEEDHVVASLAALGSLKLWQLAIKPGRPMAFGQIGNCVAVGLPGNPVAVLVCFLLYIHPLITALGGGEWREPHRYPLRAAFSLAGRKLGRREFWRGALIPGADGTLWVSKYPRDGSGLISSLRESHGLIEIAEPVVRVNEGDHVNFIPYTEFGIVP